MNIKDQETIYRRGYNQGYLCALRDMQKQLSLMNDFVSQELLAWRNGDKSKQINGPTFFEGGPK